MVLSLVEVHPGHLIMMIEHPGHLIMMIEHLIMMTAGYVNNIVVYIIAMVL